jgi:hypothetical protein
MDQTQAHASIMLSMLNKLEESGIINPIVDTQAEAA